MTALLDLSLAFTGLALSAFFSASELAFISANPLQIEVWLKQERRGAKAAIALLEHPSRLLVAILVGTTLANVFTASFATAYLAEAGWHPLTSLAAIAGMILIFGEVLPKTVAGERPNQVLRLTAPLNLLWQRFTGPLGRPMEKVAGSWNSNINDVEGTSLEREDLRVLFSRQADERVLQQDEKALISQVFEFGNTPISKAMTPRTDIVAGPETANLNDIAHLFIESGYSKLPIYRDDVDSIIGVVYLYDLFKDPTDLASIIRPVTMVPDSNTTGAVLRQLQQDEHSIAIVLDEFGGTAGLATMEDIFEELFGDFEDEFDDPDADAYRTQDGSILALGKTRAEDLEESFQIKLPEGDYETLGGYLTAHLGRIPNVGERLDLPFGTVIIRKASPRHIVQAQIWPQGAKMPAEGKPKA